MDKISWTDCVRNIVLQRVKKERNILHKIHGRKAKWIGHILRRNCLRKHVTEGQIEGRIGGKGIQGKDVRSYWMTSKNREDTGNWKKKP
jgi:hypothetical protein